MFIGITGSIGSGKTTISKYIQNKGYTVIDVDKISHEILNRKDVIDEIKNKISKEVIENDTVNRKKLAGIVFSQKEKLEILNSIMHNKIISELKNILKSKKGIVYVDIPLLFELNLEYMFDKIICVYLDYNIQLQRIIERDNRSIEEVKSIIKSQMDIKVKIEKSNYSINNFNLKDTYIQIDKILKEIENEYKKF